MSLKLLFAPDTQLKVVTPCGAQPPAGLRPQETITVQFRVESVEQIQISPRHAFAVVHLVPLGAVIDANDETIWISAQYNVDKVIDQAE